MRASIVRWFVDTDFLKVMYVAGALIGLHLVEPQLSVSQVAYQFNYTTRIRFECDSASRYVDYLLATSVNSRLDGSVDCYHRLQSPSEPLSFGDDTFW
jgi:hypothetical protein